MTDSDKPEIKAIPVAKNGLMDEFREITNECYEYCIKKLLITDKEVLYGLTPKGKLEYFRGLLKRQREDGGE